MIRKPSGALTLLVAGVVVVGSLLSAGGAPAQAPGTASTIPPGAGAPDPSATFDPAPVGAALAAGVDGGAGGEIRVVRSLADGGRNSLRELAGRDGPALVVFAVSGEVPLRSPIEVGSDLTIDGRGADVTLVGKGLVIDGQRDVIVRNLRIRGGDQSHSNDDAIAVRNGSTGVWIDHNEVAGFKDGLIDVTQESTGVTVSWNHLHDHGKTMLAGAAAPEGAPPLVDITIHHNRFERTGERNPLVRHARVHVFNNLIADWGYGSDSGSSVSADCGALLLVEGNILRPGLNERGPRARQGDCDPARTPALRLVGNDLGGAVSDESHPELVGPADPSVAAVLEIAGPGLETRLAFAGWLEVPPPVEIPPDPGPGEEASSETSDGGGEDDGGDDGGDNARLLVALGVAALAGTGGLLLLRRRRPGARRR